MKIRVDMHVHPNLAKNKARAMQKAESWWKAFRKAGIKCIISAEHSYKNPKRNYEIMEKTAPKGFAVIPGSEVISKEGVDLVVFHKDESIFKERRILTPYLMSTEAMVTYLNKKGYAYFISHPFTLGTTGIFKNLGEKRAKKIIEKAKSIEAHNTAFSGSARFLEKTMLSKVFKGKYGQMRKVGNLPKEYLKKAKFIAGGSDAHKPSDVGSYVVVDSKSMKLSDIYNAITRNKKDTFHENDSFCVLSACASLLNSFGEWCSKKKYKLLH
jgi:hypothetical protein